MFKNSTSPRFGRVKFAIGMEGPAPFIEPGAVTFTYPFNTTYGINVAGRNTAGAVTNKYERATYSTETNATNANLYVGSVHLYTQIIGGSTKSMTYGGDTNNDGAGKIATGDSYTYSTNTRAAATNALANTRYFGCGGGNTTIGYILGGCIVVTRTNLSLLTEKITLSTEAVAVGPSLPVSQESLRAGGNDSYLYVVGYKTSNSKSIRRISYSANTISTLAAVMTTAFACMSSCRVNGSGTHLYCLGGNDQVTGNTITCQKLSLSTETCAATTNLTAAKNDGFAQGTSTKIYAVAGYGTNYTLVAYGYTTATDTSAAVAGMNAIDKNVNVAGA